MFYKSCPKIDLHGMDSEYATLKVKEFINDNYKLENTEVLIVHGIGTGILKKAVHRYLKNEKLVKEIKMDFFNLGSTIVVLEKKKPNS